MRAIVAIDLNFGIGYKGKLLQPIPEDLKFFKRMTLGKIVIMGRETFESLPRKEPLRDRINIVLSKNARFTNDNVIICRSLDRLFNILAKHSKEDAFVIGGESVYTQLLPFCSEAYVTKIRSRYVADKYFTNIDELQAWQAVTESEPKSYGNIEYSFVKYANNSIKE